MAHWGWTETAAGKWTKTDQDPTPALKLEMERNFLYESLLIAQKTRTKIFFMSFGSFLFKLALVFLAPLVASLFTTNSKWGWASLCLGAAVLLFDLALESWRRPRFGADRRTVICTGLGTAALVIVVLVVLGAW
jgi:hypothetical protein